MLTRKAFCKAAACAVAVGLGALAAFGTTRVGVINWDCSPPSDTWFGGYQTRSLSPARYRYLTPYYADAKGPDEISYHRRTPAEYDRELQYAIDAGIDYFAYCWYGEDPHAKRVPLHSGRSASCEDHLWEITWARQFHMKSPLREKIGLCAIILGSHVYTDEEVAHLAEAMREPCYEKVAGGRPLLYIFGDVTKGEILARIRRAARTVGVPDPFIVAMHGTRKSLPATGDRSVQARSAYAPPAPPKGGAFLRYPDMYAAIRRVNAAWIDQGFDIVPAFATGRDHWPRIEHQVPWTDNPPMRYASPATERELVECAKDFKAFMDANRAKCPLDHVLTYAWNEFEEGAYICPLWAPNGGADTSRLKAFAKVARIFKGEQGVTAVPDDPLPDLADLRKRLPEIFKGSESSFRYEWFAARLEAAERLAALPNRTPLMQAELDEFRASFRDALAHWTNDPLNPAVKPVEINARDFGVKGDGVADDAPAFARAVDAVRKLGGRPSVLRIPSGQYLLGSAKKSAAGPVAHLDLSCLTNCAVVGKSPETTRFEFGVYDSSGVALDKSENTTLSRADFSWREAPFSQTVLETYDPSNCTAIVRHHPGTLKPDDPRYRKAERAQVCGLFTADGKALHDRGATVFFDRRADDLGGGRYRIYFDANRPGMKKFRPRPGDVIVLPDRSNVLQCISTRGSSFCNLVHVWVRNARSSTISGAGAHYVTADHCRTFPKSPDLVFSSNADTFFNARGSHLAHCEFWGMNDDGANSLGRGTAILSREGARTVVVYPQGGRVRTGDVLQVMHPMEGRFAGDFRIASLRAFKAKGGGNRWAITFDRDLPADLVTCAESGPIDAATRYAISHGLGKVKKAPDLLFFPLAYGTGFTMLDNKIHDLRGCGLNVQCPHAIIDGNVFENISLGMKITGLTQWYEGPPPCNVVVRNNVFRDCNTGIAAHFLTINGSLSKERPIRWVEIVSNRLENVARPFALHNLSDEIVRDNEIISPKPKNAD